MTTQYAPTRVVTWQDTRGNVVSICRDCESKLQSRGERPRNPRTGEEYATVSKGLHRGWCDLDTHGE